MLFQQKYRETSPRITQNPYFVWTSPHWHRHEQCVKGWLFIDRAESTHPRRMVPDSTASYQKSFHHSGNNPRPLLVFTCNYVSNHRSGPRWMHNPGDVPSRGMLDLLRPMKLHHRLSRASDGQPVSSGIYMRTASHIRRNTIVDTRSHARDGSKYRR